MNSGSQLSRMLYQSYLVSGSQLSRMLSSDAGTLGWSDPVSHDCGSFVECGPTIMPHSPAKSIFRLHVISSVHTHTWPLNMRGRSVNGAKPRTAYSFYLRKLTWRACLREWIPGLKEPDDDDEWCEKQKLLSTQQGEGCNNIIFKLNRPVSSNASPGKIFGSAHWGMNLTCGFLWFTWHPWLSFDLSNQTTSPWFPET